MTHDELLDRIAQKGLEPHGNVMPTHLVLALRTVVDLHKPTSTNDTVFCNVCWAISEEHDLRVMPVVYPCLTIQGIEKELA